MSHTPEMTRTDRARRRAEIAQHIRSGECLAALSDRLGLSHRYVRDIARQHGLEKPQGRPKGHRFWKDCPEHLKDEYDFLVRRKRIPSREAIAMLQAERCRAA